jgi:hypothetical protein
VRIVFLIVAALAGMLVATAPAQRSTPVQVIAPSGVADDWFGSTVAIDGDTMVVAAMSASVGPIENQGLVCVYRWTGSGWALEATLHDPNGGSSEGFGQSVAISGDTVIVGATGARSGGSVRGAAYVFVRIDVTWTQQARLMSDSVTDSVGFGGSVAIDGDTAVIGAPRSDVGGNLDQGTAHVFIRSGSTWTEAARLTASGGRSMDSFGTAVSVSDDTVVVGAHAADVGANMDQGAAYVFARSGPAWTQQARLLAADGSANDYFGNAVAICGDTVIVGARDDRVGVNVIQGSAYVFTRTAATWSQQAKLTDANGGVGDSLGASVSLSGDTAIVGAFQATVGGAYSRGYAAVFTRSGTTWTQQTRVMAPDGGAGDQFGRSVGISGDLAVVGAPFDQVGANVDQGSAWVYSRVGSRWIGADTMLSASGGEAGDFFGGAVAVFGDTAIVGASFDDVGGNVDQGSAYVFVRAGAGWAEQARLTAADGAAGDRFGDVVAIHGDTVIVGAWNDDVGGSVDQGSAYVFTRTGSTWTQQAKLTAVGGLAQDAFGSAVAIEADTAVVGAYAALVGNNSYQGAAYVFTRTGSAWTQEARLVEAGGQAGDSFGHSVSISGHTVIVGSPFDRQLVGGEGAAFAFVRSGSGWAQEARLWPSSNQGGALYGYSVSISGDTAIVAAPYRDVAPNVDQGTVTVFTRSGTTWTRQTTLTAPDGAPYDRFGISAAISGDMVMVGAMDDDVNGNVDQGSASLFRRLNSTWSRHALPGVPGPSAGDRIGWSVAISGDAAIVGVPSGDVGSNVDHGSAWIVDLVPADLRLARNEITNVSYQDLLAASNAALNGERVAATEGDWRSIGSLYANSRLLSFRGWGDIRTPSSTAIELGNASELVAGDDIEIFGNFRVWTGSAISVIADSFRLGSRGFVTVRSGSSLTITATDAHADGRTSLERGASLTVTGDWRNIGPVMMSRDASFTCNGFVRNVDEWTMDQGAMVTAGTSLDNRSTWTMASGTVTAPSVDNLGRLNVAGEANVVGRLNNVRGAEVRLSTGALSVSGDVINSGLIDGTACTTCPAQPPAMVVGGMLALGPSSALMMPFTGSEVVVGGSLESRIRANEHYDMADATLHMQSDGREVTLEVMSRDIGDDPSGLDRSIAGHFPIGELRLGGPGSVVQLVDASDNALDGMERCEAVYVGTLRIGAGVRLSNAECRIYYMTLVNDGEVDFPDNLIPLPQVQPCPADFNQDGGVDGGDVDAFFTSWESGDSAADVNQDGGVDGSDMDVFFTAWEAGGC